MSRLREQRQAYVAALHEQEALCVYCHHYQPEWTVPVDGDYDAVPYALFENDECGHPVEAVSDLFFDGQVYKTPMKCWGFRPQPGTKPGVHMMATRQHSHFEDYPQYYEEEERKQQEEA